MKEKHSTEKKKRVLCIGPLPPPVHGASMMTKAIMDSEYINDRLELDWVNLSTSRKMEEIGHASFAKIFRFAASYLKVFGKLMTKKYDNCYLAITCHGSGFLKDAPFVLMCKAFGRKVTIHQHNKGMSADSDRRFFKWLLKKVYCNATVILLSWRLYPDIKKIVSRSQVRICPNGIPDSNFIRTGSNSRPVILFLSNLIESKGVITLLDACEILSQRGYDFECRFVGGETTEINESRFNTEREARGLHDRVVYAGRKYGEEKTLEFSKADIFVFPSYYHNECFPLVILEAMQHSLPIITTDEGGIPDLIDNDETGMIVNAKDPEMLANAVSQLLDSPEKRIELGKAGKKKFISKFTLRKFEENILDCLKNPI